MKAAGNGVGSLDPTIQPYLYDGKGRVKRYLRFHERQRRSEEIAAIRAPLEDPDRAVRRRIENKGQVLQQLARSERALAEQSPPPVTGSVKDTLVKRGRQIEAQLRQTMLPHGELNVKLKDLTPDVRDYERSWQKQYKGVIREWKAIQVLTHPESEEPNLANVERLRPRMPSRVALNRAYLPARGYMPPLSAQGLENFEQIDFGGPEEAAERQTKLAKAGVRVRKATASEIARPQPESTKGGDCSKCKRPFYGKGWGLMRKNHERTCTGVEV